LKKPVALLLGLTALGVAGVAGAETAAAQGLYYYGPGYYGHRYYVPGMAPWRIARIVRSAGMTPLSSPARRGPVYEVVAIDPEGRHVRVAVDAYRGAITSVRPVAVLRPNGEPYGSRVAVAPPAPPPEQDDMVPGLRLGPTPAQPGAGRIPPQALPPYAGPPRAAAPQANTPQPMQPPQAAQPAPNPRIANVPAITGATPPVESQRTPIPRPRPNAAATAAVTPAPSAAPVAAPSAATTAPADVPEAPPAPNRARPSAPAAAAASNPAAAAASASAKAAAPSAAAANTPPAASKAATAKAEPRAPTTMVPVAPLD
jgi:hypothetical protein